MIQSRLTRSEVTKHGTHKESKTNKQECTHDKIKRMKSKSLNSARNRQERLPTNLKRPICEVEKQIFSNDVCNTRNIWTSGCSLKSQLLTFSQSSRVSSGALSSSVDEDDPEELDSTSVLDLPQAFKQFLQ